MVTFNYFAAMRFNAGVPPSKEDLNINSDTSKNLTGINEFCSCCNRLRSYGTHHCMKCGTCIRMLCHHSSIVNNCIGLNNYAYYFSFLIFSWIGLIYGTIMTYSLFYTCYLHDHHISDISLIYPALSMHFCFQSGELPLLFILILSAFIVVSVLLALHIILLVVDMSYISFFRHLKKSVSIKVFVKDLWKKAFLKQNRIKYKILLRERKMCIRDFIIPTFLILDEDSDLYGVEKYNSTEILDFSSKIEIF
ncbi:uncharacterized protein LOC124807331 [Hydra vulgaris]|uniref:uncharacterized protein LOC124807331 n=1 Tax=Hydra vulgaris TaxID=6087 RepID=UPI0032E9DE0E